MSWDELNRRIMAEMSTAMDISMYLGTATRQSDKSPEQIIRDWIEELGWQNLEVEKDPMIRPSETHFSPFSGSSQQHRSERISYRMEDGEVVDAIDSQNKQDILVHSLNNLLRLDGPTPEERELNKKVKPVKPKVKKKTAVIPPVEAYWLEPIKMPWNGQATQPQAKTHIKGKQRHSRRGKR